MSTPLRVFIALAAVLAACSACSGRSRVQGHLEQWDTLWVFQSTVEDTALLAPSWLAPFRRGVVVGDGNTARLTAFDAEGQIRWMYTPRTGDGPGEMRYAVDAVEAEEGLWVLADPLRLVLLSDEGKFLRQLRITPTPSAFVRAIESWSGDQAILLIGTGYARVSLSDGHIIGDLVSIPWTRTPPGDWWSEVKMSTDGSLIAVGMTYGPELLVLQGDSIRGSVFRKEITYRQRGRRVDVGGGMYRREGRSGLIPWGTWRLCIVGSQVWVLTGGAWLNDRVGIEAPRNDQLQVYSLDGSLIGTRTLPFETMDITVNEDIVYLLGYSPSQPIPTLLALGRN